MRNYRAEFTIGHLDENDNKKFIADEIITVQYPTTCIMEIDLGAYQASGNKATFQFYNLPPTIQAKLWLDLFEIGKKYVILKFYGGYGDTMPFIFQGDLMECTSQKPSGGVDWITQCWGYEGGHEYQHSFMNVTAAKGTKIEDILTNLLKDSNVKLGYISPSIPPLPRNKTFIGQTMDLLGREYGGYEIFISKGELNILDKDEVLPGDIQVITDSSGLLGSPKRANIFTEVDMLFEPGLKIDQAVELLSNTMPQFNQLYKVIRIQHRGMISAVQCGKLVTTVTLALLTEPPKKVEKAAPTTYNGQVTAGKWLKPVKGLRISGAFLEKRATHLHQGIDIACVNGSDVVAPANGIVVHAGSYGNYGYFIEINHGKDDNGQLITSRYGHLSKWLVNPGQKLFAGDLIAKSGGIPGQPGAGSSQGAHLHFEILQGGQAINPIPYIGTY